MNGTTAVKRLRSDDKSLVMNIEQDSSKNGPVTREQILAAIPHLSNEDAEFVHDAIRRRVVEIRTEKHQTQLRGFQKGDKVFFDTKNGRVSGIVKSVNVKTVSVEHCSDGKKWRVSPGLVKRSI